MTLTKNTTCETPSDNNNNNNADDTMQEFHGSDTEGRTYPSVAHMWKAQGDRASWYQRASDYYEAHCDTSLDGVLGGFASISPIDLQGSRAFLQQVQQQQQLQQNSELSWSTACECGAGIGRVTKGLLIPWGFQHCDLVESSSRLLSAAPEYIGDTASAQCRYYCQSLQDWTPRSQTYDVIWVQWVLCYLTDEDAIAFLQRCKEGLRNGGVICLKENTCVGEDEDFVVDVDDASLTRSVRYWKALAQKSGLRVVLDKFQDNFPDQIFPVYQLALSA
jgi:protein N-terminal methyltransferase